MKTGDVIIAIDPCIMDETDINTLTIGKEYTIVDDIEPVEGCICVKDDTGVYHFFEIDTLYQFFKWEGSDCVINLTPHPINILDENNKIIKTYPSKGIARVYTIRTRKRFTIEDIPVWTKEFGEVNDLPIYSFGIFYIVSQIVKSALPLRDDLLVPDDIIRDNVGTIIGCKSFSI